MQSFHELKSSLKFCDEEPSLKPLWACVHDDDRDAAKELLWKLLEDVEISDTVRSACTIYLGYMGDSRVMQRLRLSYSGPMSIQDLGYAVALANLNELDALLILRDELVSPKDEYSTLSILGCTRNCSEFAHCENTSELVSRISGLISNRKKT